MGSSLTPPGQPNPLQPGEFTPSAPASVVSFRTKDVDLPSSLYITRDDQLQLQAASSQSGEIVTVNTRLLLPTGVIVPGVFTLNPANTRTIVSLTNQLAEGFLLSVSANAGAAKTRGMTFLRAFISRPAGGTNQPVQMLFSDYVSQQVSGGFPGGRALSPTEGPGNILTFTKVAPPAGVDIALAVPVNARWRVMGWLATLTTSAAVATRTVMFQSGNSVGVPINLPAAATQAASLSVTYGFVPLGPWTSGASAFVPIPIPPNLIINNPGTNGFNLSTSTVNLQAGDQWSSQLVLVEEWLENV